jgi:abortive infection alpha-like protein
METPPGSDPPLTGQRSSDDPPGRDAAKPESINISFDLDDASEVVKGVWRTSWSIAGWAERQALGLLRARLDATKPAEPAAEPLDVARLLHAKMNDLLSRAVAQSSASSRLEIFDKILDGLVPDEARIFSALSDGTVEPLINVYARTRGGLSGEVVLENVSLVGRTANLALPALTPIYVGHLLATGLVETGPESPDLSDGYEILAADTAVLRAIKHASRGPLPARVERRVLRLTDFGHELWTIANDMQDPE